MPRQALHLNIHEPGVLGWRFALHSAPERAPRAALLLLPPFAEELNKTRRALAHAAAALCAEGFAVLQPDLLGCGDSPGEWEDASWSEWAQDAQAALRWLRDQHPGCPAVAWGVRAGALLASALPTDAQLWWQPALTGKAVLQQFLRLRVAADMAGPRKTSVSALKAELAAGQSLEVAGYRLPPALATGMEAAELQAPSGPALWLEATSQTPASLLPASGARIHAWDRPDLQAHAVCDAAPWTATELEDLPQLTAASITWLSKGFA